MAINVQCIGTVSATTDERTIRLSPRALILLAILEIEKHRPVSRSRLIDLVWQSNPSHARRHSLSQLIYEIRRRCGARAIISDLNGVRITGSESDYHSLLAAKSWAEIPDVGIGGDLLSDACLGHETFCDWRAGKAATLRRHVLALGYQALKGARERFDWRGLGIVADVMLRCDSYDEAAWAAKIEALAADGAIGRALGELASVRFLYRNDLNQPLPPSVQQLAVRLLEVQDSHPAGSSVNIDLPFTSRESEVAAICGACQRSRMEGSPQLVLVAGEPGIGKSRLIDRAVRAEMLKGAGVALLTGEQRTWLDAYDGVRQFIRTCTAAELSTLSADWQEVASTIANRRSAPDHEPGAPIRPGVVNELCYNLIRARTEQGKALLVVVDDAQWIDRASLSALGYAMNRVVGRRLVWLFATRLEGLLEVNRLASAWRHCHDRLAVEITLGPLPEDAVRQLVMALRKNNPEWPEGCLEDAATYCSGNPLLLRMWVTYKRCGEDPIDAIAHSESLSNTDHEIARTLAVLGGRTGIAVLREVSGASGAAFDLALDRLGNFGWIRHTDVAAEFTHDLLRERILRTTPEDDTQRIHSRALSVLRRGNRQSISVLAHHALASGDGEHACKYALEAATECISWGAHEEAEFFLRRAVESAESDTSRWEAVYSLGRYYASIDRVVEAKQCFEQLDPLRMSGKSEVAFYKRYLDLRGDLLALTHDVSTLVSRSVDLLSDLHSHGHLDLLAQGVSIAIEAAHDSGQPQVIKSVTAEIEVLWSLCTDQNRAFLAALLSRIHGVYGSLGEARSWAERALESAASSRDDLARLRALFATAMANMVSGHVRNAITCFEDALELSKAPKSFHYRQRILNNYGVALMEADRLNDARDVLKEGLAGASGHDRLFLLGNLAYAEILLGNTTAAILHSRALVGLNTTFCAEWVERFSTAIQVLARGAPAMPEMHPLHVHGQLNTMHEIVVQQFLEGLSRVDRSAATAATAAILRDLRGRDFLRRARVRLLDWTLTGRSVQVRRRLARLSRWAKRRGALRVAAEIEMHLAQNATTVRTPAV